MIDAKVLEGVKSWLRFSGRLTGRCRCADGP